MKRSHVFSISLLAVMPLLVAAQEQPRTGFPWWAWFLILLVIVVLFWWWLSRGTEESPTPLAEVEAVSVKEAVPLTPSHPDDLTRIEGIGPKISGVLQSAGIATYQELAEAGVDRLQTILSEAALPLANPDTWPEQARLAAAGQWGELEALQETLKGGRRA